jgi:ABC-type transport system involved in Fe-S cluster assembly fused permease/ATPase subunit
MDQAPKNRTSDFRILGNLVSLIWTEAGGHFRLRLLGAVLLILATAAFNAATPVFFKQIVDGFANSNLQSMLGVPLLLIAAYTGCQWIARICAELRWTAYGRIEQRIQRRLAVLFFDHIHGLSLRFHLARRTGALQQIVGNGLLGYCLVFHNMMFVIVPLAFELFIVSVILTKFYHWTFLLVFLVTAVLYILTSVIGIERQRIPQRAANAANVDAFARATDSYLNYETIKYFGTEARIREEFDRALMRAETGWSQFYSIRSIVGLIQSLWLTFGLAATVTLAACGVAAGTMTIGDFVLVNAYILQLIRPLENLGFAYREIKTGITYVENLLDLLVERAEVTDGPNSHPLRPGPGEVVFTEVSFTYGDRKPVLNKASFRIPAGHIVAMVGPSGAGKSTIFKLLFRFYDVTDGRIEIDGQDLRDIRLASLRASIAVIPQDVALFNDTIAYNIGIGRPSCGQDEIERAARLAEIHDFIDSLRDGYNTIVGERGLKLSGGERQRVAIARAVLKLPRIYIFDEATSALDEETEHRIQRNLKSVFAGATVLVIAHRLSTIEQADNILVVSGGRVVEYSREEGLLALKGTYAGMWEQNRSV